MSAWPAALPDPSQFGYTQVPVDGAVRTPMQFGPDKVRRRVTYIPRIINCEFVVTDAQYTTLDDFYQLNASDNVNVTDPLTQASAVYKFVGPPVYNYLENGYWKVNVTFEVRSET